MTGTTKYMQLEKERKTKMEIRKINDDTQIDIQKMLTLELIKASEKYYNGEESGMSDIEFDKKVEELKKLEESAGFRYEGSPTYSVGAMAVTELKTVKHEYPALSLDKVKYNDRENLVKWLKDGKDSAMISWKNDGLTVCATYDGGKLIQAVTRGNGEQGSDITHNAMFFKGLPKEISYKEHLVVRGEAVMKTVEFERVNALSGGLYENPRNLASATIQMLDSNESKKREINFIAFELVYPVPSDSYSIEYDYGKEYFFRFQQDRFDFMEMLGFDVVDHECCDSTDILSKIEEWKADLANLDYPTDGLVISYNDMVYGMSLGATGHHFRHSVALKWPDETVSTTIRGIDWSIGKTGIITPVAVFDKVRLGLGSNVTRASLHNLSIMKNMPTPDGKKEPVRIGAGAEVYLANMIIPKIATIQNSFDGGLTCPTEAVEIPTVCPVCGQPTRVENNAGVEVLHCDNTQCPARQIGNLMNTFSKDGLFIKGLGESQITDLMEAGMVNASPYSFYDMARAYREFEANPNKNLSESGYLELQKLLAKDRWGQKKWNNLIDAIDASRNTTLQKFLYSLNIPLLGNDLSKKLSRYWNDSINAFTFFFTGADSGLGYDKESLTELLVTIEGIAEEKAGSIVNWAEDMFVSERWETEIIPLINELNFPEPPSATDADNSLEGITFVITGAVHDYKNRDEFKASVERRGGKVAGSVSSKTNYLVNNDITSTSGKNAKAKALGIEIISEDEFITRFGR